MDKIKKKVAKKKLGIGKKSKTVVLAARTRLEPRLSSSKKKIENVTNIEQDKRLVISLDANKVAEYFKRHNLESIAPFNPSERNAAQSTSSRKKKYISRKNIESDLSDEDNPQSFKKQYGQHKLSKGVYWSDKELRDLAHALQQHGFADEDKLQAEVKTKTSNDIKAFIKSRVLERRKVKNPSLESERHRGRPKNQFASVSPEILRTWPSVRKWRRLLYEQMSDYIRARDYSGPVISALCNKFYEEEPELTDPQVIDVKLIYKYIADCMTGKIPPQLPPKESALVVDLLREVTSISYLYDFEEERQFLKGFSKATAFKPVQVKDEFKKRLEPAPEVENDCNSVSVPEEIFLELNRHRRLATSFNPLVVPVWMLQKEQEYLENYFDENVYID